MYGLMGMRQNLTKKESGGDLSTTGYTQSIPQTIPGQTR